MNRQITVSEISFYYNLIFVSKLIYKFMNREKLN